MTPAELAALASISEDDARAVLDRVQFHEAERRCRRILTRLQLLHDAPTAHIRTEGQATHPTTAPRLRTRQSRWQTEHTGGRGDALPVKGERFLTSRIPTGVRVDGGHEDAPDPVDFSLWGYYSYRMEQARMARDTHMLTILAEEAERDYQFVTGLRRPYHEKPEAAVTELLRDCEGLDAARAARWLRAPEEWVKRQRRLHLREPDTGLPREPRSERERQVLTLRREGKTQAEIAQAVGVSQQRVSKILGDK